MPRKIFSRLLHAQKIIIALGLILALIAPVYGSNRKTAAGFWQTLDPDTGKVSAIVHVWRNQKDGYYYGKLYKIFNEGKHKKSDRCKFCKGIQKNKPMLGLTIIFHMVDMGEGYYQRGRVLDPRDGSLYHAQMRLLEDGQVLKLRGYILIPLFGKSAIWRRATPKQLRG